MERSRRHSNNSSSAVALRATACIAFVLAGCGDGGDDLATVTAYDGCTVVTTNASSYTNTESIVVSWTCLPGNNTDWIAIAAAGSPVSSYVAWVYTYGAASGSHSFAASSTGTGTFVARAFENNGYTLLAESTPFDVTGPPLSLTTDASSYVYGTAVVASWANMVGSTGSYVVLAPESPSGPSDYYQWAYTAGATSGSHTFTAPLPLGNFIVRAFDAANVLLGESAVATVTGPGGTPTLTTDASSYGAMGSIVVSWSALPGYSNDWLAIAREGASTSDYLAWVYTGGAPSGSHTFSVAETGAGTFVARAFAHGGYTLVVESAPFTVTGPPAAVTTDATSYAYGDPVVVSWANLGTGSTDWVVIAPEHPSGPADYLTWSYTGGTSSGSHTFDLDLLPGRYIARAFENNSYRLLADSAVFEVVGAGVSPDITVDHASYGAGDAVVVSWSAFPGYATDWIALSRAATGSASYVAWVYTAGATTGSHTFAADMLAPGTYVARGFENNGYVLLDESASFTVTTEAPTIATDHATYAYGAPIVTAYAHAGVSGANWVALARPGSDVHAYFDWYRAGSAQSGAHTFTTRLPLGSFVARIFENDSYLLLAESAPFVVTGPGGARVDAPEVVPPMTMFDVTYADLANGTSTDWISIAPFGSPITSYTYWQNAPGGSGSLTFGPLAVGRYEARAFFTQSYALLAATDDFIVPESVCMETATLPLPDGTPCGIGQECFGGLCVDTAGGCGNGVRNHGAAREGCDDGYQDDGDACSASCEPTALVVEGRVGLQDRPTAQLPALAEDGTGMLLFVWLDERIVAGEPTRDLVARRYSSAGRPIVSDVATRDGLITIESDVGSSEPVRPSVVGLPTGWAVAWRSTRVEPRATGEQGGIALAVISRDGGLGTAHQVNESTHLDQLDPVVAAFDTGLAVVWTDYASEITTGDLRLRFASLAGVPSGHEQAMATTSDGDQSRAFAVARGSAAIPSGAWAVAWTTAASAVGSVPEVHLRRFDRTTPSDASEVRVVAVTGTAAWASEVALAASSDGYFAAWTSRAAAPAGDVAVRFIADGTVPTSDASITYYPASGSAADPRVADTTPAIAAFPVTGGSDGYIVAYTTATGTRGRLASSTTLPSEATALEALIASGQSAFSMLPTERGLWIAWDDQARTSATDAFVAYLMPWD